MKLSNPDKEKLRKELDSIGENLAREKLAQGIFNIDQVPFVESWLKFKDEERTFVASSKRDAREEETLSIAKEANFIASRALETAESEALLARRSRWIDRIIPTIAIIIAAIAARDDIMWLISWLINKLKTP